MILTDRPTTQNYWIFKISTSSTYADVPGQAYVFDNTHSIRVRAGDEFLYLKKGPRTYAFTGAGRVKRVSTRQPQLNERRNSRVKKVFTAHLDSVINFDPPYDISRGTEVGRQNRLKLGLPADVNTIGWSFSMPKISYQRFVTLVDAALRNCPIGSGTIQPLLDLVDDESAWHISNRTATVNVRGSLDAFRRTVLERHCHTCLICGTQLRSVLEAAHIRDYSVDPANRANPSNGVCLCRYCHAAFDAGDVQVIPDGTLEIATRMDIHDEVANYHFSRVTTAKRKDWLSGVNLDFLEERARVPK